MTTVQESPNGHSPSPPPCLIHDSEDEDHSNKLTNSSPEPLPDRCQFTFSDSRQCTMARSDIHPSLCLYHSEREEQLFGVPAPGAHVVGAALDLPELYSACRDLTTAAGVHRALAQVFRLLAQRRISRQEAATFAKLGQLLLQSISAPRSEAPADQTQQIEPCSNGVVERQKGVSSRESHGDQELSRVNKGTPLLAHKEVEPAENSLGMNTSSVSVGNSRKINTYANAQLKPVRNQHLRKNGGNNLAGKQGRETNIRSRVGATSPPR